MKKEILRLARAYRDGAHTRVAMGGRMSDHGYQSVYDAMREDARRVVNGDEEMALYVWGVFLRAARSGARMAELRQPLPGQEKPACW